MISKYKLHQCVALCHSLEAVIKDKKAFQIIILCVDKKAYKILTKLQLKNVRLVQLDAVETDELRRVKESRRINEYCWTLKPVLLEYVLVSCSDIDQVIHLDADLFAFNDPIPIFEKQPKCSVLLSEHDFSQHHKKLEKAVGKTNSGIVSFKRDEQGLACMKWWKDRCVEWCYSWVEPDRFGDQKYLDQAPSLFSGVSYINTPGVNIAPWNDAKYTIALQNGMPFVDGNPLIIYHFCSFVMKNKTEYYIQFSGCNPNPSIYNRYMKAVCKALEDIEIVAPSFNILSER